MKLKVDVKGLDEVKQLFRDLGKDAPRAMVRTINKTLPGVRTDMTQAIYDHYAVTKTKIRGSFSLNRAKITAPAGTVATQGSFLNLSEFGARQTQKGVTVKILRKGSRKLMPNAFLRTVQSGKALVLSRTWHGQSDGKSRKKIPYAKLPRQYRYPVKALSGPRLQDHLAKPMVWAGVERQANERLLKAAAHEADYLIKQKLEQGDGFSDI